MEANGGERAAAERAGPGGGGGAQVMRDPVVAADGHTYERAALEQWLALAPPGGLGRSPMTGLPLAHAHVCPNFALRSLIAERLGDPPLPPGA